MELSSEFWVTQGHRVILGTDGSLRFTAVGREYFAPLLARYGFAINQITSVEAFKEAMGPVISGEVEQNTKVMEALLENPRATDADRQVLLKILGRTEESLPMRVRLRVVR
jgi:hypothetical protein